MAKVSVEKFIELVQRCQLIEKHQLPKVLDELKELVAQLEKESKESGEPGRVSPPLSAKKLGEYLVEQKRITRWQCDQLLNGRHKGFFLGKYKLLGLLGKGGMSSVYLAEHIRLQSKRAIKVLPLNLVNDSTYLPRFYREARAAAQLNHEHIVLAYDVANEKDIHYLIMEYVEGRDVFVIVRDDGKLDSKTAADFTRQAADGLAHAHEMGLIHRDIKPANLLVDSKNIVKVLDMGLARFSEDESSLSSISDKHVLGTADYLSPEQAVDSHNVDTRTDIYSLGCSLYYMLTGQPPFPEGTLAQRILKHQTMNPTSILELRSDVPQTLVAICQKMMEKNLDDRYQTAEEVRDALFDWLESQSVGAESGSGSGEAGSSGKMAVAAKDDPIQFSIDTGSGKYKKPGSHPKIKRPGGLPASRRNGGGRPEDITPDFDRITTDLPKKSAPAKKEIIRQENPRPSPGPKTPTKPAGKENQIVIDTSVPGDPAGHSSKPTLMAQRTANRKPNKPPIAIWIVLGTLGGLAFLLIIIKLFAK